MLEVNSTKAYDPFGSDSIEVQRKMAPVLSSKNSRPIFLTREGDFFRLSFSYSPDLVAKVKGLPYSRFDGDSKTWLVDITTQAVDTLKEWYITAGLTDVSVETLLRENEVIASASDALLRRGSIKRPYIVTIGLRSDTLFNRLRSIPGAVWEKNMQSLSYPAGSASYLDNLVKRGVLSDPDNILNPHSVTVGFNNTTGEFYLNNEQASEVFRRDFPNVDLIDKWRKKGFDVGFTDSLSEEVYYGELRRNTNLIPEGFKENLYPYQSSSVAVAVERTGFAIYHAPGLGKTPIAIAWALELLNRNVASRVVIVTPGAIKTQFAREITRFTGHSDVVVIDGDKSKREKGYAHAQSSRWVVLNYDLLHVDSKYITPLVTNQLLVADEAHKLKSRTSKRTQAMKTLASKSARRLALSGTPVENDPAEWYTIMNGFVVPGIFGNPIDFFNRYSYPGRFGGYEGARNLKELQSRSKPHYIRFKKDEVATHLPPLRVQNLVLDPDEKLAVALKNAHKQAQEEIKNSRIEAMANPELLDDVVESGSAMTAVGMLRIMCSSPRLIHLSESSAAKALVEAGLVPDIDGPKLDELRVMASQMQSNEERLVVFTSFRSMANLIAERFKEDSISYVLYTGASSTNQRDEAVKAFTTREEGVRGPTVFIATDAASEGLNLGKECSTLVNFDLPYKPSTIIQRSNRIHRVDGDQNKKYLVINFTIAKTLEEGILNMVGAKADIADAILGEAGTRKETTGRYSRNLYHEALKEFSE